MCARLLATATGPDRPSITAELTGVVAATGTVLLDVEQVVVRGRLTLCFVLEVDDDRRDRLIEGLRATATRMGLDLTAGDAPDEAPEAAGVVQLAVTLFGDHLDAVGLHAVARMLSRHGGNIERVHRLSDSDLSALELIVSMPGVADVEAHARTLRHVLLEEAGRRFDIAIQRENLSRRAKRLVAMDMDSTLIQCEVIDELARRHGVFDEVATITAGAMHGELDFEASLRARVGLLAGLPVRHLAELAGDLPLTPGATALITALRRLGFRTALISGGFLFAAEALKHRLGLDYAYANQLEHAGGVLTGRVREPVVTPARKADLLDLVAQGEGVDLAQTIAIGDGANDLPMLDRAGLGIAFHAKPSLQAAADTAVSHGGLDRVLYLLGLRARDVAELIG